MPLVHCWDRALQPRGHRPLWNSVLGGPRAGILLASIASERLNFLDALRAEHLPTVEPSSS